MWIKDSEMLHIDGGNKFNLLSSKTLKIKYVDTPEGCETF